MPFVPMKKKDWMSVGGLSGFDFRTGVYDYNTVENNLGRILDSYSSSWRGPHHYNSIKDSGFFGSRRYFNTVPEDASSSATSRVERVQAFEGSEIFMIHALDHLCSHGDPVWILYGAKLTKDGKSVHNTNRWVVPQSNENDNDQFENFNMGEQFYEFHLYNIGNSSVTGSWLTGKVLNYLWNTDKFRVNGHYFVGYPLNVAEGKSSALSVPSDKVFQSKGLVFRGSFMAGDLISAKATRELYGSNAPIRSRNRYLQAASILKLLEWTKGPSKEV